MSRRDTGFPDEVKALVLMRSDGRCEACGERTGDLQYHHRRARGKWVLLDDDGYTYPVPAPADGRAS